MTRLEEVRTQALQKLQDSEVLMLGGHFDYGNGYHGRTYLNAHQLFRYPSTIWQLAQDLIDILPSQITMSAQVIAGPATGGALLAHTLAGLLDGRRALTHPPSTFAPFSADPSGGFSLRPFYARQMAGKLVLLADDVRNTGKTFERCAALVSRAGGTVIATVEIYDRLEAVVDLGVPNISLASYRASENFRVQACPMCKAGEPITTF
ncbi:MAG: phosphoribosyltransferase family protein [Vicinamibacterales bacterium]